MAADADPSAAVTVVGIAAVEAAVVRTKAGLADLTALPADAAFRATASVTAKARVDF